jgi:hypothetical protein
VARTKVEHASPGERIVGIKIQNTWKQENGERESEYGVERNVPPFSQDSRNPAPSIDIPPYSHRRPRSALRWGFEAGRE